MFHVECPLMTLVGDNDDLVMCELRNKQNFFFFIYIWYYEKQNHTGCVKSALKNTKN